MLEIAKRIISNDEQENKGNYWFNAKVLMAVYVAFMLTVLTLYQIFIA